MGFIAEDKYLMKNVKTHQLVIVLNGAKKYAYLSRSFPL